MVSKAALAILLLSLLSFSACEKTEQTSGLLVRDAKLAEGKHIIGVTFEDGQARSSYGTRNKNTFTLSLQQGDAVRFSVQYGEPAVQAAGSTKFNLKAGEQTYVEAINPGTYKLKITSEREIDEIVLNVS